MRFLAAKGRASNGTITELAAFYRAWYRGHIDPYVFGGCTCGCVTK